MAGAILCPFCKNGTIDWADLRIDLNANVAACADGIVRLTPIQAVFVDALVKRVPEPVPYERLFVVLWGSFGDEPEDPLNRLRQIKVAAGRRLRRIGYEIEAMWGVGYRLTRAV